MNRAKLWLRRYWLAEAIGTCAALLSALVSYQIGGSLLLSAVIATWAENAGYYGTMLARELRSESARRRGALAVVAVSARNLSLEFGPAEVADTLLVRPALMYAFPLLAGNVAIGVVLGKLAADAVFYVPVIASLELRQFLSGRRAGRVGAAQGGEQRE